MNENVKWVAAAVAVVGLSIGAVVFRDKWWRERGAPDKPAATVPATEPETAPPPEEPAVRHPLPPPPAPLPKLADSDVPVRNSIAELTGEEFAQQFVIPTNLVRHIVVSVDNLPNEKLAERLRPVRAAPGSFVATGPEESPVLDPANFERYKPIVQMVGSLDTATLVATYVRYYPLFQESYESLGHAPEYFNDRVIEVIDHLLSTPDLQGPVALTRPGVLYEYADPAIESRSAGQKALIRIGSENAAAIKAKLSELRAALVAQRPGG